MITDEEYLEALVQWSPQLHRLARSYIPYYDYEDILQELRIVLFKCLQQFNSNNGAKFHTYLTHALRNRLGRIKEQMTSPVVSKTKGGRHNPPPNLILYLGTMNQSDNESESSPLTSLIQYQLSEEFEESTELHLSMMGYDALEISWIEGKAINLTAQEIADLAEVSIEVMKAASITAKVKSEVIRDKELLRYADC